MSLFTYYVSLMCFYMSLFTDFNVIIPISGAFPKRGTGKVLLSPRLIIIVLPSKSTRPAVYFGKSIRLPEIIADDGAKTPPKCGIRICPPCICPDKIRS